MESLTVIREYLAEELINHNGFTLTDDVPLIEAGYLTSLQTVDLVLFLEQRFDIEIDPEEVTEENFRNINGITALVDSKLNRS